MPAAALIAACTSCAAASMSRSRSNCSVIWLSAERAGRGHRRQRRDLAELALERRGDQRRHRLGAGARQLRRDLDGREIDLRQRRDRQRPIAERAAEHQRDPEQRGRDRPADEGRGDAHGLIARLARTAAGRFSVPCLPAIRPSLRSRLPDLRACRGAHCLVAFARRAPCSSALRLRCAARVGCRRADRPVPTVTSAPSARPAKPVVTTRSDSFNPLAITASFSSCCCTVDWLGRDDVVASDDIDEGAVRPALHRRRSAPRSPARAYRPAAAR